VSGSASQPVSGSGPLPRAGEHVTAVEGALAGRPAPAGAVVALACELHASNARQWDLEDLTHDPAATDGDVAAAKRAIDRLNLARHDLVERMDAAIAGALEQAPAAALATETPGMVIDRLSVLVIRIARTGAAAAADGDRGYAERLPILRAQLAALTAAFDGYLDELRDGRRRFLRYEQFKLYGADPAAPTRGGGSRAG
jgi:hypothetical protein